MAESETTEVREVTLTGPTLIFSITPSGRSAFMDGQANEGTRVGLGQELILVDQYGGDKLRKFTEWVNPGLGGRKCFRSDDVAHLK